MCFARFACHVLLLCVYLKKHSYVLIRTVNDYYCLTQVFRSTGIRYYVGSQAAALGNRGQSLAQVMSERS